MLSPVSAALERGRHRYGRQPLAIVSWTESHMHYHSKCTYHSKDIVILGAVRNPRLVVGRPGCPIVIMLCRTSACHNCRQRVPSPRHLRADDMTRQLQGRQDVSSKLHEFQMAKNKGVCSSV